MLSKQNAKLEERKSMFFEISQSTEAAYNTNPSNVLTYGSRGFRWLSFFQNVLRSTQISFILNLKNNFTKERNCKMKLRYLLKSKDRKELAQTLNLSVFFCRLNHAKDSSHNCQCVFPKDQSLLFTLWHELKWWKRSSDNIFLSRRRKKSWKSMDKSKDFHMLENSNDVRGYSCCTILSSTTQCHKYCYKLFPNNLFAPIKWFRKNRWCQTATINFPFQRHRICVR